VIPPFSSFFLVFLLFFVFFFLSLGLEEEVDLVISMSTFSLSVLELEEEEEGEFLSIVSPSAPLLPPASALLFGRVGPVITKPTPPKIFPLTLSYKSLASSLLPSNSVYGSNDANMALTPV